MAAWAVSPAVILFLCALIFGRDWPHLNWAAFLGGVTNMYVFSAYVLIRRNVEEWTLKAALLTLVMLAVNAAIFLGASVLAGL